MRRMMLLSLLVVAFLVCALYAVVGVRAALGELTTLTPAGLTATTAGLLGAPACAYLALRLLRSTRHA